MLLLLLPALYTDCNDDYMMTLTVVPLFLLQHDNTDRDCFGIINFISVYCSIWLITSWETKGEKNLRHLVHGQTDKARMGARGGD